MKTFLNTSAMAALSGIAFAAANEGGGGASASVDLYDFSDLSDLPEEMQTKLSSNGGAEPALVQEMVEIIVNAPRALSLAQVIAVAIRKGLELPAETTVRSYVNRAAEDGRIVKPTRQTYAAPGTPVEEAAEVAGDDVADEADPLADLG